MQIRLKALRYALAAAVCGVLATGTGFAQEKAPSGDAVAAKAGSDAPRGDAPGAGGSGAIKSGSDAKAGDAGTSGDRATVQNHPASPQTIELSKDAGHKGTPPAATTLTPGGPTPGSQNVTSSHGGINLVTPHNGYAGLLRRANRKALIANNAAKRPVNPLAGTANLPLTHPGREGPMARNAVGLVMPPGTGRRCRPACAGRDRPHARLVTSGAGPIGRRPSWVVHICLRPRPTRPSLRPCTRRVSTAPPWATSRPAPASSVDPPRTAPASTGPRCDQGIKRAKPGSVRQSSRNCSERPLASTPFSSGPSWR